MLTIEQVNDLHAERTTITFYDKAGREMLIEQITEGLVYCDADNNDHRD